MEVHTHTHTAHKKWAHYFREFLMSDILISPGTKLINHDAELLALYSNRRQLTFIVLNNYILNMKDAYSKAIRLVAFIKKEYHLE